MRRLQKQIRDLLERKVHETLTAGGTVPHSLWQQYKDMGGAVVQPMKLRSQKQRVNTEANGAVAKTAPPVRLTVLTQTTTKT
jgi:hypothetical protein